MNSLLSCSCLCIKLFFPNPRHPNSSTRFSYLSRLSHSFVRRWIESSITKNQQIFSNFECNRITQRKINNAISKPNRERLFQSCHLTAGQVDMNCMIEVYSAEIATNCSQLVHQLQRNKKHLGGTIEYSERKETITFEERT